MSKNNKEETNMTKRNKELSLEQREELLRTLQVRFLEKHEPA